MAAAVLSATAVATVPGPLPPAVVAEARLLALSRAHERVLQQWRDGGAGVLAAGSEFCRWLAVYGEGRNPVTCTPDDVLAYFEDGWLQEHRGRGGGQPAYATVAKAVSLLSSYFVALGRDRVREGPDRNPCAAPVVAQYLRGYRRERVQAGVPQSAAVPLSEGLVADLSLWLVLAAADPELTASARLALLRDRAVFLLLWATCMRAHDCGKLRVTDFRDPLAPQQRAYEWWVLPRPVVGLPYPRGAQLYVWELVDKTHQFGRALPYRLESAGGGALCPVEALAQYYYACQGPDGIACGPVTGFVFRPLSRSRQRFEERALGTSTLGARLRAHLCTMGQYGGETCHSFRRGRLQHEVAQGAGLAELMALGHMRSPQSRRCCGTCMRRLICLVWPPCVWRPRWRGLRRRQVWVWSQTQPQSGRTRRARGMRPGDTCASAYVPMCLGRSGAGVCAWGVAFGPWPRGCVVYPVRVSRLYLLRGACPS